MYKHKVSMCVDADDNFIDLVTKYLHDDSAKELGVIITGLPRTGRTHLFEGLLKNLSKEDSYKTFHFCKDYKTVTKYTDTLDAIVKYTEQHGDPRNAIFFFDNVQDIRILETLTVSGIRFVVVVDRALEVDENYKDFTSSHTNYLVINTSVC